jgi:hypothetical protein
MNHVSPWTARPGYLGDHNSLKRLGREFSMNGVNPSASYVLANTQAARAMFGNQGMHDAAEWLAALHPHALQYLEQAPVLALAASLGGMASSRSQRAYIAMNFKPMCERGARLRDVMKAYAVAYPLRALSPASIRPGVWSVVKAISNLVEPSTIAQAIPEDPTRHRNWLGDLDILWTVLTRRQPDVAVNAPILGWAMLALTRHGRTADPAEGLQSEQIADFLICNRDRWNARWTWARMIRKTQEWHETLANADIDRINDRKYDVEVPYTGFPSEVDVNGHQFVALRSLRALTAEGKAMHHCVASYYRDIQTGTARIYSVRKDCKRMATVEFCVLPGRVRAVQIKGPCNARPCKTVIRACDRFAELLTCHPSDYANVPPATVEAFMEARA